MQVQPASPGVHEAATHMSSWHASASPRLLMPHTPPLHGQPSLLAAQAAAGVRQRLEPPSHTSPVSHVPVDWQ